MPHCARGWTDKTKIWSPPQRSLNLSIRQESTDGYKQIGSTKKQCGNIGEPIGSALQQSNPCQVPFPPIGIAAKGFSGGIWKKTIKWLYGCLWRVPCMRGSMRESGQLRVTSWPAVELVRELMFSNPWSSYPFKSSHIGHANSKFIFPILAQAHRPGNHSKLMRQEAFLWKKLLGIPWDREQPEYKLCMDFCILYEQTAWLLHGQLAQVSLRKGRALDMD